MTTHKAGINGDTLQAEVAKGRSDPGRKAREEAGLPHRSTRLDWDEMMLDYAAVERRAQAMRSEMAWSIARVVREWAATVFGQGETKARAAARQPFGRHSQPT